MVLSQNVLYLSSELSSSNLTASPYSPWYVYYDLSQSSVTNAVAAVTPDGKYFYVISTENVYVIKVSLSKVTDPTTCNCGYVSKITPVFRETDVPIQDRSWGEQFTVTSSSKGSVWIASSTSGLIKVDVKTSQAEVIELPFGGISIRKIFISLSTFLYYQNKRLIT